MKRRQSSNRSRVSSSSSTTRTTPNNQQKIVAYDSKYINNMRLDEKESNLLLLQAGAKYQQILNRNNEKILTQQIKNYKNETNTSNSSDYLELPWSSSSFILNDETSASPRRETSTTRLPSYPSSPNYNSGSEKSENTSLISTATCSTSTSSKRPSRQAEIKPKVVLHFTNIWKRDWSKEIQVPYEADVQYEKRRKPFEKLEEDQLTQHDTNTETISEQKVSLYDADKLDTIFLSKLTPNLPQTTFENIMFHLESTTNQKIQTAIKLQPGAGIEYDNDQGCNACMGMDCYDMNPIVFCDGCDVAVHQLCYGIEKIPEGEWYCDICIDHLRGIFRAR